MSSHPVLDGGAQVACNRYCAIARRLPVATYPEQSVRAANLAELRDDIDVFVLDGYGVLNVGSDPVPGAVERVAALRASGALVLVLTNGASLPHAQTLEKYQRLGFEFTADDVISSRQALERYLSHAAMARRWGVMAPEYAAAPTLFATRHTGSAVALADDPALYDALHGFILLSTATWSSSRQAMLSDSLRRNPRPVLVGNPDLVAPFSDGFSLEPGWYAHELTDQTACIPHFFGKPFANAFDLVRERIADHGRVPPHRIAMVGDTLHTDILGGAGAGWKSVLITDHGLLRDQDVEQSIQASGIRPDYICPDP